MKSQLHQAPMLCNKVDFAQWTWPAAQEICIIASLAARNWLDAKNGNHFTNQQCS